MDNELILAVDNDEKLCQVLALYLRSKGYDVLTCRNGANAVSVFTENHPTLVLLDINLPGMNGFEILQKLNAISNVPVVMISAMSGAEDRIHALELGADDYIVKPFSLKELVARIRAVFRRCGKPDHSAAEKRYITAGPMTLDLSEQNVIMPSGTYAFNQREFALLSVLVKHKRLVVGRGELISEAWAEREPCSTRTLDVAVSRLRKRLKNIGGPGITTVRGVGYRLDDIDPAVRSTINTVNDLE